jgi:hypothetical protein
MQDANATQPVHRPIEPQPTGPAIPDPLPPTPRDPPRKPGERPDPGDPGAEIPPPLLDR